jgi:hypothetical protein
MHESEHAASLQRAAIVAVQDERRMHGQDGFGEVGALQDGAGMRGILRVPDLGGDDLAAVEVENDIEAEEVPEDGGGQPCDVPCPHRVGSLGRVGGSLGSAAGSAGQPAVMQLTGGAQDPVESRLRGEVAVFVGESRDDACRGHGSKAWFIADPDDGIADLP